jgi:hypothetical protein
MFVLSIFLKWGPRTSNTSCSCRVQSSSEKRIPAKQGRSLAVRAERFSSVFAELFSSVFAWITGELILYILIFSGMRPAAAKLLNQAPNTYGISLFIPRAKYVSISVKALGLSLAKPFVQSTTKQLG